VRQLRCLWSALYFFRSIGKRASEEKGYVLTMQNTTHEGHQLADDSFALSVPNKFQEAYRLAVKYRSYMLLFSVSWRLVKMGEIGVVLCNSARKELPDKSKPQSIVALLRMLED
jgi:hypothetical protein